MRFTSTISVDKSKVKFKVESVGLHPSLNFSNSSGRFRTISPIAITTKTDERKIKYVTESIY